MWDHDVPDDVAYRAVVETSAPVERVWALLADHAEYSSWSILATSRLVEPGRPAPNGVGAVRFFGFGRIGSLEEVVAFEPPHRLAYRIVGGLPIASYRAEVRLTPMDTGTRIEWTGGVARGPKPVRRVVTAALAGVPKRLARDLGRAAARG